MKKFYIFFSVFLLIMGAASAAHAIPYTDTYDAGHTYMHGSILEDLLGTNTTVSWVFNIADEGFNPATQDVTAASVTLNLADDSGNDFWEIAHLNVGTNSYYWEVETGNATFGINSLLSLGNTGMISTSLSALLGDFYFNSATLTADATSPNSPSPVPEPGTLLLFGLGLVGLCFFARRGLNIKQ